MVMSDGSSDLCSSDLSPSCSDSPCAGRQRGGGRPSSFRPRAPHRRTGACRGPWRTPLRPTISHPGKRARAPRQCRRSGRSEEHTSELQSLMRISYAVFCLKKKTPSDRQAVTSTNINYEFYTETPCLESATSTAGVISIQQRNNKRKRYK